jgi:hypothetical protein
MQATVPKTIGAATITLTADGVYGHDSEIEIVLPVKYYDAVTTQLSYAEITLSSINPPAQNERDSLGAISGAISESITGSISK